MQELIIICLTLTLIFYIIKNVAKNKKKNVSSIMHRQSDVHKLLKYFFSIPLSNNENNFSQLTKHKQKSIIKVIVLGDQAYWVSNNTFYVADAVNGKVQKSTTKPVDIESLPKVDLDKMLFILDTLRDGKRDDSGSAGNK
jgi:hypothetical protein